MKYGSRYAALAPVLISLAAPPPAPAAPGDPKVVCGGEFWASAKPAASGTKPKASAPRASRRSSPAPTKATANRWVPVYRSPGLESFSGKQRAAVAARGVVWSIDVTGSGANQRQAVAALIAAGAAAGWPGSGGTVFFRAPHGEQQRIAAAALQSFGAAPAAEAAPVAEPRAPERDARAAGSRSLTARSALVRIATELSATDLIAGWPTGVIVLPVRGGQLVRAAPADEDEIRRDLSARGARWEAVAASTVAAGRELGSAAEACRQPSAPNRVATPKVKSAAGRMAMVDVEGQSLLIQSGELLLVVPDRVTPASSITLMRLE